MLLLYTDGLAEARSGGQIFGEDRIAGIIRRDPGQDATILCKTLLEAAREYSDFARIDSGAHDCRAEVRAAAAQRRRHSRRRRADEPAQHDELVPAHQGRNMLLQPRVGLRVERRGIHMPSVGHDHAARIHVHRG